MVLDFLYRKVDCYYCKNTIKRKDAINVKVLCHGKLLDHHLICFRCATMIKYLQEGYIAVRQLEDKIADDKEIEDKLMAEKKKKYRGYSARVNTVPPGENPKIKLKQKKKPKQPVKKIMSNTKKTGEFSGEPLKIIKSKSK